MHSGASMRELYGALEFHMHYTTFSHLHTSHVTIVSFQVFSTSKSCLKNYRQRMLGEEDIKCMLVFVEQFNLGMC